MTRARQSFLSHLTRVNRQFKTVDHSVLCLPGPLFLPSYCSAIPHGNVLFWMVKVVSPLPHPGSSTQERRKKKCKAGNFFKKIEIWKMHTTFRLLYWNLVLWPYRAATQLGNGVFCWMVICPGETWEIVLVNTREKGIWGWLILCVPHTYHHFHLEVLTLPEDRVLPCVVSCSFKCICLRTSLVVQWVRLCTPNAGGLGLIPGQGTRSHMHAATKTRHSQNK